MTKEELLVAVAQLVPVRGPESKKVREDINQTLRHIIKKIELEKE